MTLEEISIEFTADAAPLIQKLNELTGLMKAAKGRADALESAFYASGANAGAGLAAGITSKKAAVAAAAAAVAQAAAAALRGALQINSPSRVTRDFGRRFDEGLALGMKADEQAVGAQAQNVARRMLDALELPRAAALPAGEKQTPDDGAHLAESLKEALNGLSLSVPLEVDGYRLGVAAAQGLRQVRQATGRAQITL